MSVKISGIKSSTATIFKYYLALLLLANLVEDSRSEHFGKLITEGKLCTDLDVDDVNGEYTDLGTDVDLPQIFHHVKTQTIPYPHTLRIVVPVGSVIQFQAFAAMAIDENGNPTGRFHSCTSPNNVQQSKITTGRCTISLDDWERNAFMGYQEPLRIISTEKYPHAIEFFWTWVEDRPAPELIQFRFLGVEKKTILNPRATFYGVLASPVVETTNVFQHTPPIPSNQLNSIKCFESVQLNADHADPSTTSDYFILAAGFAPQQQIPLNPKYLKLIQDNIDEFAVLVNIFPIPTDAPTTTTESTSPKPTTPRRVHKNPFASHHLLHPIKKVLKAKIHPKKKHVHRKPPTIKSITTTTELVETTLREESEEENYDFLKIVESLHKEKPMYEDNSKWKRKKKILNADLDLKKKIIYQDNSKTIHNFPIQEKIGRSSRKIVNRTNYNSPPRRYYVTHRSVYSKQGIKSKDQETTLKSTVEDKNESQETKYTTFHAISILFIWFVCVPNAFFITRYFKESQTSKLFWGKSLSFILHLMLLTIAFVLIIASTTIALRDLFTRDTVINLLEANEINIHMYLGFTSSILLCILVVFEWISCKQNSRQSINAGLHFFAGNISYILALIMIWRSYYIGMPCATWIITILWIIWTVTANIIMCSHFYWLDTSLGFKNYLRAFIPMPITIAVQDNSPDFPIKERILYWHFGGSWIAFILISLLYSIKDAKCANCQFEFVLGCTPENH